MKPLQHNTSFYDLFDKMLSHGPPLSVNDSFELIKNAYGLEHVIYNHLVVPFPNQSSCFIESTYPDEWAQRYYAGNYIAHDPVALHSLIKDQPFDWEKLPKKTKMAQKIFSEWGDAGYGTQGLTIPLHAKPGEKALFHITALVDKPEWQKLSPRLLRDLSVVAQFDQLFVTDKKNAAVKKRPNDLSDTEVECLKWAASGKSIWETSVILSLPERNVRYHLDQARRKLHCNTKVQAVARAVATGLINIS